MSAVISARQHLHGRFEVFRPDREDAELVARNVRPADLFDIRAATRLEPFDAIMDTFDRADRRYGFLDAGTCVAIAGIEWTGRPGEASVWLLGTPGFDVAMRSGGLKVSREFIETLLNGVESAFNFVPVANERTLRWLTWLGFERRDVQLDFRGLGWDCVEVRRERGAQVAQIGST